VRGGIGVLAEALSAAVRAHGGEVHLANAVRSVSAEQDGFAVATRHGTLHARAVVANALPHGVRTLLGRVEGDLPHLDRIAERVEDGWGAAMLYLAVEPPEGADASAHHLQIVQREDEPFAEGNHLFASVSGALDTGRAPPGLRTITVSTHVPMPALRALPADRQGAYIADIQRRMRAGLDASAPEWMQRVVHAETASPRTFERFTRRFWGYVGGAPRRAGIGACRGIGVTSVLRGLYLVGDSVFPGQSTLATAIGGVRVAERIARDLDVRAAA
jgi:phytoene dehydrogenase-like protein